MAFWNNPRAVTRYCKNIISTWRQEIVYRQKNKIIEHDGHIIKALSHPALRGEAPLAIQEMLLEEKKSPGFLSVELLRQAENMIRGEWLPWVVPGEGSSLESTFTVSQEETTPDQPGEKVQKSTKVGSSKLSQTQMIEPWKQTLIEKWRMAQKNENSD